MILAADIGGTKTTLALFEWERERVDPVEEQTFDSNDYENFEDMLEEFLTPPELDQDNDQQEEDNEENSTHPDSSASTSNGPTIEAACFGVAGPVLDNRCRTTNLPWTLDGEEIAQRFNIPLVKLLNDLEATSYGVLLLRPDELETLNSGTPPKEKRAMGLIAAGTGLGESLLFWDGTRYQPMPSEGGHADFAPNTDQEIELLRHVRTNYLHVSYERVLSGAGLHTIYEFIRDTKKNEPTWLSEKLKVEDPPATIAEAGLKKQADIAVQALDLFTSIYGAEAGNLALKGMTVNGMFLGGGIAPKLFTKLEDGSFMRAFTAKGRYKRLMNAIPVKVIMNQQTALLGAAAIAAQLRKPSTA